MSTTVDEWWGQLRAAALVGTARRDVPPLPALGFLPRDGATREEALLDAAALGDAVRRAGRVADPAPEPHDVRRSWWRGRAPGAATGEGRRDRPLRRCRTSAR